MTWRSLAPLAPRIVLAFAVVAGQPALAGTLIVSGNDAKVGRVDGSYVVDPNAPPDQLVVLDAAKFPPRIIGQTAVHHSVSAPPTAVALSPDEKVALLAAPNRIDPANPTQLIAESFLQVPLPHQPQSVAINKAGTLAVTVQNSGELSLFAIHGIQVELLKTVPLGGPEARPNGVAFTPDGHWLLVSFRGQDKVAVLSVQGEDVSLKYQLATGHSPYVVKVAPNGKFAIVGDVTQSKDEREGVEDSVTLIDLTTQPFKVVQQLEVPLGPEGLAISPDSTWVAVCSINGSNAKPTNPAYHDFGILSLFRMNGLKPALVGTAHTGHNTQGAEFTPDARHLLVQDYVEAVLSTYEIGKRGPVETGIRIGMPGRPASIAVAAR
jgi:DNA-binding beta-propeller fold protein YncE